MAIHKVLELLVVRGLASAAIPPGTRIGPGLKLIHEGNGVIIHPNSIIGSDVTIHQQVTIGERVGTPGFPVIGNNVKIGAGAKILGGVNIGENAKIGANAVVLKDVPANATAVGVPARIIVNSQ